ncbi:MAG TPA: DUF6036 family nucleotidyltransferase [Terracidiphilus sp.]|jgi:hypothetical protein|nr:DUF6036 family nucleotidyltransferase [Terracidiphilus sp.]
MPQAERLPDPWNAFFTEIDNALETPLRVDCIGGFVVTMKYGMERPTADIDVVDLAPRGAGEVAIRLGALGGPLWKKHGIYLEFVAVSTLPDNYEERLTEMFPKAFAKIRLMAVDPYDLALSKLERNSQKDRDDLRFLARTVPFDLKLLRSRYESELRWQLGNPAREDLTLQLWMEMIQEDVSSSALD